MRYYAREIETLLIKAVRQFRVVVLTGARQTGKSTLLRHVFKETHKYITFDNPRDLKLAEDDPELFFEQYPGNLIIDEVQYAPQILPFIKMKVDSSSQKGRFILTGSQRFEMMRGLQETLAGRAGIYYLYPFSVREGAKKKGEYVFRALNGSYPELMTSAALDSGQWVSSYLTTYIEKDVQLHYKLEKIRIFRDLIFLLAARCGQVLNYNLLSKNLGVSLNSVKSWVRILEVSGVIYLLQPYHTNLGSRIVKSPKIYFCDTALVSFLTGVSTKEILMRGPQAGALFENFVVMECVKFFSNMGIAPPVYHYRNNSGLEIDLLIEVLYSQRLIPCEIKLSSSPHKGMTSGIERLRSLLGDKGMLLRESLICRVKEPFFLSRKVKAHSIFSFMKEVLDDEWNSRVKVP